MWTTCCCYGRRGCGRRRTVNINWFVLAGTLLYLGASVWEFTQGRPWLGWTYLCYSMANVGLIMISRN